MFKRPSNFGYKPSSPTSIYEVREDRQEVEVNGRVHTRSYFDPVVINDEFFFTTHALPDSESFNDLELAIKSGVPLEETASRVILIHDPAEAVGLVNSIIPDET